MCLDNTLNGGMREFCSMLPHPYNKIGDGPEGVEITLMAKYINENIIKEDKKEHCKLLEVKVVSGRYLTHSLPKHYQEFNKSLKTTPLSIQPIHSKGKLIYLTFDDSEWNIWITLGLTGHLITTEHKHTRVVFKTTNGDFYLDDTRNFGTLTFAESHKELEKKLTTLGPDLFQDTSLTAADFLTLARKMKPETIIALALVDQKRMVSGIGNYLRAEILYEAGISPFRKLKDLSDAELKSIYKAAHKIMKISYESQLEHPEDNLFYGYDFKVYMRETDPDGRPVENDKLADGRTIWWVKDAQK